MGFGLALQACCGFLGVNVRNRGFWAKNGVWGKALFFGVINVAKNVTFVSVFWRIFGVFFWRGVWNRGFWALNGVFEEKPWFLGL